MRQQTLICAAVIGAWVVVALTAPFVIGDANTIDLERIFSEPSKNGLFGYDDLGRDIGLRIRESDRRGVLLVRH